MRNESVENTLLKTVDQENTLSSKVSGEQVEMFSQEEEQSVFTGEEVKVAGKFKGLRNIKEILTAGKEAKKLKEKEPVKTKTMDAFDSNLNDPNDPINIIEKEILEEDVDDPVDSLDPEKLERVLKDPKPTGTPKTGEVFNYDLILDGDISSVLKYFSKGVKYQKLDTSVLFDQASVFASQLGFPEELIDYYKKGVKAADEFQKAAAVAVVKLPDHLKLFTTKHLDEYLANPDDRAVRKNFKLQTLALMQHIKYAKLLSSKAGQTTALHNKNRVPINMDRIDQLLDDPQVASDMKAFAMALKQIGNPSDQRKLIEKASKFEFAKKFWKQNFINGMLTSTGTPLINFTSGVYFTLAQPLERLVAAGAGMLSNSGNKVYFGESLAMISGAASAFKEALVLSAKTYAKNESQYHADLKKKGTAVEGSQQYGKIEVNTNFDSRDYGFQGKLASGLNWYSTLQGLLGNRVLLMQDDFFKAIGYRMELHALAYRKGAAHEAEMLKTMNAKDAHEAGLKVQIDTINNPPEDIDMDAQDFATVLTFQKKLDGAAGDLAHIINDNLFLKTMIPFVTTPTNIVIEGLKRSPFALVTPSFYRDWAAGGAKRNLAVAKMGVGTMIMYGATSLANNNRLTGKGPGDRNHYRQLLDDGWRPYSVVLRAGEYSEELLDKLIATNNEMQSALEPFTIDSEKNLYIPFRYFEPASAVLAMGADLSDYILYEQDNNKINQVVVGSAMGLANYITNSPFMQMIGKLTEAVGGHVQHRDKMIIDLLDTVSEQAATFLIEGTPIVGMYQSLRKQTTKFTDEFARSYDVHPDTPAVVKGVYTAMNKYISTVPGLSDSLPGITNIWNEPKFRRSKVHPSLDVLGIRAEPSSQRLVDKMLLSNLISVPNFIRTPMARFSQSTRPVIDGFETVSVKQGSETGFTLKLTQEQKNAYYKYLNEVTENITLPKDEKTNKFKEGYLFELAKDKGLVKDGQSYKTVKLDLNLQETLVYYMQSPEWKQSTLNQYKIKQTLLNKNIFRKFHNYAMNKLWNDPTEIGKDLRDRLKVMINDVAVKNKNNKNLKSLQHKLQGKLPDPDIDLSDIKKEMKK